MAALIREHDWATTPLGPTEQWPGALRVALGMALASPRAIAVYWGHDFICLYNDAYRQLMGDKHPGALGRPAREVFPEAREVIGPMFRRVLETGQAAAEEQRLLPLERGDASLEGWFTYTAEPILDAEGNVVGILNPAAEVLFLRRRESGLARPYLAFGHPWTTLVALALMAWMIVHTIVERPVTALVAAATIAAGLLGYAAVGARRPPA